MISKYLSEKTPHPALSLKGRGHPFYFPSLGERGPGRRIN
jgi:hypothetical protein